MMNEKQYPQTAQDWEKLLELVRVELEVDKILSETSTSSADSLNETIGMVEGADSLTLEQKQERIKVLNKELSNKMGLWL